MIDYKLLTAMAFVISEGGFEKAAQKLYITQSAVSQRVKLLEELTGQVLITRTVPPKATKTGKRLIKHYMQVKSLEAELETSDNTCGQNSFKTLAVGINADSLATWFLPAVDAYLKENQVVLDLKIDDQDETHKMLRNGEVAGCISSEKNPVQGCRVDYLGTMNYRFCATQGFIDRFFAKGFDKNSFQKAPGVIFNRKDDLHSKFFIKCFNRELLNLPIHYIPSSKEFANVIFSGNGYGMIPDLQGLDSIHSGGLIDMFPECHIKVKLYWHRWNLNSKLLDSFSKIIVKNSMIC